MSLDVRHLGRRDYAEALELMRALATDRADGNVDDTLLLVEHDPVYTAGRRDAGDDVLGDLDVVAVERGGRVTYHGPGQVVAYPIVALTGAGRDLHAWLRLLEDVIIDSLATLELTGTRDERGTGVFVGPRKIASIGIAVRRWVTFHGLALNVTTDLDAFAKIRPCGFAPDVMTSVEREKGAENTPSWDEVANRIAASFRTRLRDYPR